MNFKQVIIRPKVNSIYLISLLIGFVILIVLELGLHHYVDWLKIVEHLAVAIIIGSFIGLTLDAYHHLRKQKEHELIKESMEKSYEKYLNKMLESIKLFAQFTPATVFNLIKEIISNNENLPTIYSINRDSPKEYTILDNLDYFDKINKSYRNEFIKILKDWMVSDNKNVKFLASDLIGHYKLTEIADDLLKEANKVKLKRPLSQAEDAWVLNFLWAYSACQENNYKELFKLLNANNEKWINDWVLHVPVQMPDEKVLDVLNSFVATIEDIKPYIENFKKVVVACEERQIDVSDLKKQIFEKHSVKI